MALCLAGLRISAGLMVRLPFPRAAYMLVFQEDNH